MESNVKEALRQTCEKIQSSLEEYSLSHLNITVLDTVGSTNTLAKQYAKKKTNKSPLVIIAREQTGGRGRLGRSFVSRCDTGLYISFLIYPEKSIQNALTLTAKCAVAVARAIENLTGLSAQIKWVNDVYINGRKLAGILCEGELNQDGTLVYAVVGIGINLVDVSLGEELDKIATNIERECGKCYTVCDLAPLVIKEFFTRDENFMEEYRSRAKFIGEEITVSPLSSESFTARAVGISDTGGLIIERDGKLSELISAEISIRPTQK